jgi:hypothetical protein
MGMQLLAQDTSTKEQVMGVAMGVHPAVWGMLPIATVPGEPGDTLGLVVLVVAETLADPPLELAGLVAVVEAGALVAQGILMAEELAF